MRVVNHNAGAVATPHAPLRHQAAIHALEHVLKEREEAAAQHDHKRDRHTSDLRTSREWGVCVSVHDCAWVHDSCA